MELTSRATAQQSEPEIETFEVLIRLCSLCLEGAGGECHTPGCAMWLNRAPDLPLREHVMVNVFLNPGGAPVEWTLPEGLCRA